MVLDAKSTYQDVLDRLTQAALRRDRQAWADGIAIPHQLFTPDGKLVHETARDVNVGFADYVGVLARQGITQMERTCLSAEQTEPGQISGHHSTVMRDRTGNALPTFNVHWTILLGQDGNWRVSKVDARNDDGQATFLPHNDLTQFQREDTTAEANLRRVMQNFFSDLDLTFIHGDFGDWHNAYTLPVVVERGRKTVVLSTEDELREDFEQHRAEFALNRVTEITRVVRTAEAIGDTQMIATYRAHALSDGRYVLSPWDGAVTMRLEDDRWHITKIISAFGPKFWKGELNEREQQDTQGQDGATVSYIHTPSSRRD